MTTPTVFLSRRNLLTLLSKLDRNAADPGSSAATIIKHDTEHPTHPQSHKAIVVKAVEDDVYYADRVPGPVHELDEPTSTPDDSGVVEINLSVEEQDLCITSWVLLNLSDVSKQVFHESVADKGLEQALYNAILNEQINYALIQVVLDLGIKEGNEPTHE
jgi:hypothetical protein